jgi:hypothetical protein
MAGFTADHNGSTFGSFLEQAGIREDVEVVAAKRVLAWRPDRARRKRRL